MKHEPYGPYEKYVKRPLDCFLSVIAFIVLSPLMLMLAVLVRIKLGSPVFFVQERPGKNEKIFKLYKFRTMTDAKDDNGNVLPDTARLTSFGKVLRMTSLDELPELLNIIKGDMAIIGPRPLLMEYLPYYTETERRRHDVRPGLSGLAQVNGRNFMPWDQRLAYDIQYVKKIKFLSDMKILFQTVLKVMKRADVAADTEAEGYLNKIRSKKREN